ncbi:MAG TPA: hypothetical protein VD962_04015 [Rubricoccaceae bacterium]|nr:hypothetical protein [Rubricoccaceae bacterium]
MPFRSVLALLLLCAACAPDAPAPVAQADPDPPPGLAVPADTFGAYWYQGQAELTSYTLEQARYGALRPGDAVLVFVTEPFSRSKHVKVDDHVAAGDDAVTVLKLNATRNFITGVYPYSTMTSVFTPVDAAPALKVTTSVQEWCGQVYTQLNRAPDGYRLRAYSYFEREGDQDLSITGARLEDDLWALLRLNPDALPTGALRLVPGTLFLRLKHVPFEAQDATATLTADSADAALRVYTVTYPALRRTLAIRFRAAFPFEIEGWEETYPDGRGGEPLTTRATRRERIQLAYWQHNGLDDTAYRTALGLPVR